MADSVYKVIELIGTSKESWEKAATAAVSRAGKSLRDLRVAEIVKLDLQLDAKGEVEAYRADCAAYYERCVRILAEVEETESALSRTRTAPRGRLRVDIPASFGRRLLVPALAEFFERYPEIRLEVGCTDRPVDLLEEGVDCVVRGGEQTDSSLVARRVATYPFVTCATPAYLARYGVPSHPRDLERHRCIRYFMPKTGRIVEWDFKRDGERIVPVLDDWVALNDGDAYAAAGLAGLGRLTPLLAAWATDPLPIYVMYPQNRHLSAKVRAFVDWVAELFAR